MSVSDIFCLGKLWPMFCHPWQPHIWSSCVENRDAVRCSQGWYGEPSCPEVHKGVSSIGKSRKLIQARKAYGDLMVFEVISPYVYSCAGQASTSTPNPTGSPFGNGQRLWLLFSEKNLGTRPFRKSKACVAWLDHGRGTKDRAVRSRSTSVGSRRNALGAEPLEPFQGLVR